MYKIGQIGQILEKKMKKAFDFIIWLSMKLSNLQFLHLIIFPWIKKQVPFSKLSNVYDRELV